MSVGISGGGGLMTLEPFSKEISTSTPVSGVLYTALSITGKGELSSAIGYHGGATGKIKVTIDGAVVHFTSNNGPDTVCGVSCDTTVQPNSANTISVKQPLNTIFKILPTIQTHPYTTGNTGFIILSNPLPFESSLLIEVSCNTSATSTLCTVKGGVYE